MQLLEEGLPNVYKPDKHVLIFEHQKDHKFIRQEPLLGQTGLFVAADDCSLCLAGWSFEYIVLLYLWFIISL